MFLSEVKNCEQWIVRSIDAGMRLFNRLASMGICEGTKIMVVKNNKNGPVIIDVNGGRFAIGRGMAEKIVLEREKQ